MQVPFSLREKDRIGPVLPGFALTPALSRREREKTSAPYSVGSVIASRGTIERC